jgi:hypothetical protein
VAELVEHNKTYSTGIYSLSIDELYLFGKSNKDLDMIKFYQDVTNNEKIPLTKELFFQHVTNISADPYILESTSDLSNPLNKDVFNYDDWMSVSKSGIRELFVPIGMEFQDTYDFRYPSNPYHNQLWTQPLRYEMSQTNQLLTFNKSILLDYTESTNIFVCLAKDVYKHANNAHIPTEYFCNLYFPFLQKRGLNTTTKLSTSALEISDETYTQISSKSFTIKNDIIDTYREIYWTRQDGSDLPYIERGITQYSLTIRANDYSHDIPMDLLFRNLHATPIIPFIKYNPGNRRENMYRLFYKEISTDGRKIPSLDESVVMRLSRETGKGRQISLYIHNDPPMYMNINMNSEIEIYGSLTTPLSSNVLDKILISNISPIIDNINIILNTSGYSIRKFDGINGFHIHKTRFTYQSVLPISTKFNIDQQLNYITPIFDVINSDVSKGAQLMFKRVRNYREMDAKFSLIRDVYERTSSADDVVQGLIDNFNMTTDSAILLYGEFCSQFKVLNHRIIDNPGFPTKFHMRPMKNELVVEVTSITSPQYLDIIHVYIDTILRLSQKPKSVTIPASTLKQFKNKTKGAIDVNLDNVETIIAPIPISELAKPMQFNSIDDVNNDNVQDPHTTSGLDFDEDDFDYDYGEEGYNDNIDSDDSDDDYYGGDNTPDENDTNTYKADIDGMPIKNPSPFFKRMLDLDPTLYVTEESSKFPLYSKACPSGDKRQPVILTDAEKKRIDETNPGSYGKALLHGSSKENKHWYVCPRYWCLKTNSSISEADVKAGKCGSIIPRGSDRVPKGAYVYEFNNPKVHMKNEEYVQHVPGFLKKDKHPDGLCIPCCFGKEWDSKDQTGRRAKCDYQDPDNNSDEDDEQNKSNKIGKKNKNKNNIEQPPKLLSYIISSISYPLPQNRWGFLPESLQLFLKTDNSIAMDPQNHSIILHGEPCILRYGVEKSENQSFLSCFAYYYAYKHNLSLIPTLSEMRNIFAESINIDLFIQYHNGNLVSIFRPKIVTRNEIEVEKYESSKFYKAIDLTDETQFDHLEDTIASYEHFLDFIRDDNSIIDHTYLWDFFCNRNPKLLLDGMNLIILQISDNDITEKVQMICPSNAYSHVEYNPRKETVILIKQENFYEPIHLYEQIDTIIISKTDELVYSLKRGEYIQNKHVMDPKRNIKYTLNTGETKKSETIFKKAFLEHTALDEIKNMLKLIQATTNKYCTPLQSMPRKYSFKRNIPLLDMIRILKTYHYKIIFQILNYRNKIIGVQVIKEDGQYPIFLPCFPSSIVPDIDTKFMDDDSLWIDYRQTRDRLTEIASNTKLSIFSKPIIKIVEDGLVVGFLTETNQFVQINPPSQPFDEDGIKVVEHSSEKMSDGDKTLTSGKHESEERRRIIRHINLETQFYNIFRSLVRIQLNNYDYRKIRLIILNAVDEQSYLYKHKLKLIEKQLHILMDDVITFSVINPDKLHNIESVVMCNINTDTQKCESNNNNNIGESSTKLCLTTDDGKCRTIFPKLHLLSGKENISIYFGRMADELVRYNRIRIFMFNPKTYMNITNTDLQINNDELFLLESRLVREYFRNIIPYNKDKYINNIEFDNAHPELTQPYVNKVDIEEQHSMTIAAAKYTDKIDDYILDCISQTKSRVIGNEKFGSWRPIFPVDTKELIFNNTIECSFIPIIHIFHQVYNKKLSIKNIKISLWKEYSTLIQDKVTSEKIYSILRKQGKRNMIDRIRKSSASFEAIIFSEEYYITDFDLWIFCKTAQMPVILFSSTTLKHLSSPLTWIKLGGKGVADEKYFFIRSPSTVSNNYPPSYHLLHSGYTFSELKGSMFLNAERGDALYKPNMQSIEIYIEKTIFNFTKHSHDISLCNILYRNKIAHLLSVSKYYWPFVRSHFIKKFCHYSGICFILTYTVYVKIS